MESYNIEEKFLDDIIDTTIKRNDIVPSVNIIKDKKSKPEKKNLTQNKNIFLLKYFNPKTKKFEHLFVEKNK